jgi:hypothetical protein
MSNRLFTFPGGRRGIWRVSGIHAITGETLPQVDRVDVLAGAQGVADAGTVWFLRGIMSNERYVAREEKTQLAAIQEGLGRPSSTRAALIPIRKE